MTDDGPSPLYECQRDLAVAEAVAEAAQREIREITEVLQEHEHLMAHASPADGVRRLMALAYNDDDGTTRLPLDPVDARTAILLHAIDTAWGGTHVPEDVTPTEFLWNAVRGYMES